MSSTEQATPSTAAHVPTEEEVLTYFDRFSNWGRWGADDQAGTLNFITAEKRLQAARLVQDGTTVSLAKLLTTDLSVDIKPPLFPAPTHFMLQNGEQFHQCGNEPYVLQTALDYFGVAFHNVAVTHLDAVGHVFWDGKMYNGVSSKSVSTIGATVQSVDVAKDGIVSRGVLLDIPKLRGVKWLEPGDIIRIEELEAAEAAAGIRVEEGGSDAAPSGYEVVFQPIHQVGLVAMGLWLVDFADLDPVAAACEARGRWEFMLSLGALRIQYGTGSPVNPIAIF
jgi:hypothetical protein